MYAFFIVSTAKAKVGDVSGTHLKFWEQLDGKNLIRANMIKITFK